MDVEQLHAQEARQSKVIRRIQELLNNKAFLANEYADGNHWADREIDQMVITMDTCYRIDLVAKQWWIVYRDVMAEGRKVRVFAATKRNPDIGIKHDFEIKNDGRVAGLPAEFSRRIFSWEF